ncbi:MAG: hypothetical protein HZA83_01335 [Thaumarchaeota archaeon]|nr:hypothetical protein [Nitrososphaerota archaeon]
MKKQRKGISAVLTTLIILVASVILGTTVTLYGTSLFQSGVQQQALAVSSSTAWLNSTGSGVGAFVIRNTGDKVIGVDSITIRGVPVPFASWWYNNTSAVVTGTLSAKELKYQAYPADAGAGAFPCNLCIKFVDGTTGINAAQASGPVLLKTGQIMIVYYAIPSGKVSSADLGASVSVGVFAGTAGSVKTVTLQSDA